MSHNARIKTDRRSPWPIFALFFVISYTSPPAGDVLTPESFIQEICLATASQFTVHSSGIPLFLKALQLATVSWHIQSPPDSPVDGLQG
jgi:hypothetical protein